MPNRLWLPVFLVLTLAVPVVRAQELELTPDRPHPRLLLPQRRVRLLQRERERDAMRWQQFAFHMQSLAAFPEPGFAHALYYVASQDKEQSELAIRWALDSGEDLRQLALVFDWCHDALTAQQSTGLIAKMIARMRALEADDSIESIRDRVLAIAALDGETPEAGSKDLQALIESWWRQGIVREFRSGGWPLRRRDAYPLMEILHVVRDGTGVDMRTDYRPYFAEYPAYALLTFYPAVYPAGQNNYRIPLIEDASEPDLADAARTRAADLALVAFAPNDLPVQFLQGFHMFDEFLMRGTFGIPYEFLWANAYQPGLSYYNTPLLYHDPVSGVLIARSNWDGDGQWLYLAPGLMQTFANGRIELLTWDTVPDQVVTDKAVVLTVHGDKQFRIQEPPEVVPRTYYLVGLEPDTHYDFEVDDEGLAEYVSDHGGIVKMQVAPGRSAGVRFQRRTVEAARIR